MGDVENKLCPDCKRVIISDKKIRCDTCHGKLHRPSNRCRKSKNTEPILFSME